MRAAPPPTCTGCCGCLLLLLLAGWLGRPHQPCWRSPCPALLPTRPLGLPVQWGANVVSASFGGWGFSTYTHDAIDDLRRAGGLFVAAAGNSELWGGGLRVWLPPPCSVAGWAVGPTARRAGAPLGMGAPPPSGGGWGQHPSLGQARWGMGKETIRVAWGPPWSSHSPAQPSSREPAAHVGWAHWRLLASPLPFRCGQPGSGNSRTQVSKLLGGVCRTAGGRGGGEQGGGGHIPHPALHPPHQTPIRHPVRRIFPAAYATASTLFNSTNLDNVISGGGAQWDGGAWWGGGAQWDGGAWWGGGAQWDGGAWWGGGAQWGGEQAWAARTVASSLVHATPK